MRIFIFSIYVLGNVCRIDRIFDANDNKHTSYVENQD